MKLQLHARSYFRRKRKEWAERRRQYTAACQIIQRCFWRWRSVNTRLESCYGAALLSSIQPSRPNRAAKRAEKRQRLQKMGSCHLCCSRRPDVYFEYTEQSLCRSCLGNTISDLDKRGINQAPRYAPGKSFVAATVPRRNLRPLPYIMAA